MRCTLKAYNILKLTFLDGPKPNFGLLVSLGAVNLTPRNFDYLSFCLKLLSISTHWGAKGKHRPSVKYLK